MKFFDPEGRFILQWNKTFLLCSVIALSLDPLFFYIPIIDGTKRCLDVDHKLEIIVCVLRSFADMLFVFHIIIQFRTAYVPRHNHILGKRIVRDEPHYVATRYFSSYFIIDVLAALPLPQLAILVIIPNLDGPTPFLTERILKLVIFSQYVPRVIRISLFYKKVTKISGFLTEKAWAGAAFNFFLYVLASHVVGALWYLFVIESEMRCWNIACERNNCYSKYLYCGEGRVGDFGFLSDSCPLLERNEIKDSTNFDFGIFLDALQTRVLETRDFPQKFLYCSWWGLQSLSSLGQGLKASTFYGEILFADFIAIIGLVLFALLIGNMQKYLQSFSNLTLRVEEMKEKRREAEDLMSHISLPENLRERVRRHKHYKWKITKGVELDSFVKDLPRDLRRDIKRHLCLSSLMRVPMFEAMDEHMMDAMCDRLKPVLYTQNSYILREGDPVPEMLFITRGTLQSITTDGGRAGFFNSDHLRAGDFCGEELLTWALAPPTPTLPFSTRTVQALTDVEAFALSVDDLMFVASQFKRLHSRHLQHTFRFYSQQWRTWAACYIQSAWRRHWRRKLEMAKALEDSRMHDAFVRETSTLSLGASIYAARFSSNALRVLRRKNYTQLSKPVWQIMLPPKPPQPDFENHATAIVTFSGVWKE
ncbi:cyclic nucleotide-gated ion channel 1 [Lactuca sativa]|uniref:cyclic nucleotide-gated ion channel 1 n=1 Tax=Lactuca sativa TaxID=4236 RepID=UPI000CD8CB6B|nr:cyclic nucleotide-gated ion channel 1 [Lactuca sativa]